MATLTLQFRVPNADASVYAASNQPRRCLANASRLVDAVCAGKVLGTVFVSVASADPVAASATCTVASALAADTITIGGKAVLTGSATPSGESQWLSTGSDTVVAAAIVAKINAHTVAGLIVSAASVAGVITITTLERGNMGNHIGLVSSNGTRLAVTGSGYLASGAGGVRSAPTQYR